MPFGSIIGGGGGGGAGAFTPVLTRSAYIDGASYGEIANAEAPLLVLTGSFTVEAWVHLGSVSGERVIASVWNESVNASKCWRFSYNGSTTLQLYLWNGAAQVIYSSDTLRLEDNGFQHVAVVFDYVNDTATFYLNGALVGEDTSAIVSIQAGTAAFRVGAEDGGADYFLGHISCLRVWDDERTQAEINEAMYSLIGEAGDDLIAEYALNGTGEDPISGYDLTSTGIQWTGLVPWRA